ncbi:MAG: immunoglobulin-like domain-containing protein [Minisyncoccia bacterium]
MKLKKLSSFVVVVLTFSIALGSFNSPVFAYEKSSVNLQQVKTLSDNSETILNKLDSISKPTSTLSQDLSNKKQNLSESKKKLGTDLLRLIDSNFLLPNQNRTQVISEMKGLKQFVASADSVKTVDKRVTNKIHNDLVYVYVNLQPTTSTFVIDSIAWKVTDRDEKNHLAVALVEVNKLETLASLKGVKSVSLVLPPVTRSGSVVTEGDLIHQTDDVRNTYSQGGAGMKIGVISDGVDNLASAQTSGDLPPAVTVLSNFEGGDEGTAMLEIIHDMVPNASLYFHDAGSNVIAFNSAIDALIAAGANVIVDDVGWITEPFFEDGTVASHVASVLAVNNIVYVSSAGNNAEEHYQGIFNDNGSGWHDFSAGLNQVLLVSVPNGGSIIPILQWNDSFGSSSNDYDLYLVNQSSGALLDASESVQNGDDDPFEGVIYTNISGSTIPVGIYVNKFSGVAKTLELFINPKDGAVVSPTNITGVDSIFGHAAVPGVITVGAINANDPGNDTIEPFSSQGPVTIIGQAQRAKTDITGIDCVSTSAAIPIATGLHPFCGTSAAAPAVAAIVAQLWGQYPTATGTQIKNHILNSAVELGTAGTDSIFGHGRADSLLSFQTGPTIASFNFTTPAVTGVINENAKTISLTVPYGTNITALVPTIAVSAGTSVGPLSGVAQDFSSPVIYTATSVDGLIKSYTVTVTVTPNPAKAITSFDFTAPTATGVIDESAKTISLTVPFGTNVTALVPTIEITGASIVPNTGIANNFTTLQTYTVTALDSSTQAYVVTVAFDTDPDIAKVATDKAALVDSLIQGANADLSNITTTLTSPLPALGTINGSTITWASNTPSVVSNDGQTVVRPAFGNANATVILTATITKGVVTDTKTFTLTVLAETLNPDIAFVASDKASLVDDSIKGGNSDLSNIEVALTDPLPSLGANGSTITWLSSDSAVVSNNGQTINRPAFADGNATITMTATITKGVITDTKVFTLTVLKLPASTVTTITSSTYTVGANTISNVTFNTSKTDFLAALTKGELNQTWNDAGINNPVVTGNTLVVTAQDGITTVAYTVTVNAEPDTTAPIITLNGITPDIEVGGSYTELGATATDAVDGLFAATPSGSVDTNVVGTYTITYTATDVAGNIATPVIRTINVVAVPIVLNSIEITTPATKLSYTVGESLDITGLVVTGTYSDSSTQIETITNSNITGFDSLVPIVGQILTITVNGKTTTYTVDIIALPEPDTTAPVITLNGTNPTELTVGDTFTDPVTASDNIDGDITANIIKTGTFINSSVAGTYTIIYNVSDAADNPATEVTRTVNVNEVVPDTIPPIIESHDTVTAEATSSAGAVVNYTSPNATDNVDATEPAVCLPASGILFIIGTSEITCNKTDTAGNIATPTTFNVIVQDTTPPEITLNGDTVINLIVGDSYADAGATASDIVDGDLTGNIIQGGDVVNTSQPGSYIITYNVADAVGNPATQTTRTVNVSDTEAPTINSTSDITTEATSASGAIVIYDESTLTATDDIDGVISVDAGSCIPASGSIFALRTTPVSCSATDSSGNEGNGVAFSVIIEDTTIPTITMLGSTPIELTVGDSYTDAGATASDIVDGDITDNIIKGGTFVNTTVAGTYTITYDVSDMTGNNAVQVTRTVIVGTPLPDTTLPVITLTGSSTMNLVIGQTFSDPGATASDNVDGNITANIVVGGDTVNTANAGTYIITYNVSDVATNAAIEVTRTVIVTTPPPSGGGGGGSTPPATKKGDANKDGKVDKYDFALIMANWGKTGTSDSDFNGDNKVDKYDFALLMSNWGL